MVRMDVTCYKPFNKDVRNWNFITMYMYCIQQCTCMYIVSPWPLIARHASSNLSTLQRPMASTLYPNTMHVHCTLYPNTILIKAVFVHRGKNLFVKKYSQNQGRCKLFLYNYLPEWIINYLGIRAFVRKNGYFSLWFVYLCTQMMQHQVCSFGFLFTKSREALFLLANEKRASMCHATR